MRSTLFVGGPRHGETMMIDNANEIKFPGFRGRPILHDPGTRIDLDPVEVHTYKRDILRTGPVTIEVMAYMGVR